MNAFEQIVEGLFRAQGYWTIVGYKVKLKKTEKVEIGTYSMPRPELDILAYKGNLNELIWIECKSYLDSGGVRYQSFTKPDNPGYNRYKVFNYPEYRKVISSALIRQTVEDGLTQANPRLKYCLVAGNTYSLKERKLTSEYFKSNGWLFYDEEWLTTELSNYSESAYEDDITRIVSKLIHRNYITK